MEHHELELNLVIEQILFTADLSIRRFKLDIQRPEAGSVEAMLELKRQVSRIYLRQERLFLIMVSFLPKF